jgi:serine/threonine protein kinase
LHTKRIKNVKKRLPLPDFSVASFSDDFMEVEVVGEGGYGKVWKVELVRIKKYYAMKEMSKGLIVMKKSVDNVLN